ncbi:MAG: hypothetical protein AABZ61_07940, partial [Bacteroidota bacterium]
MITPFEEFRKLCKQGNIVPVVDELLADTDTPVSAYLKIRDESPYSFLFESVEGGEKIARYSFVGFNPFMFFEVRGKEFAIRSLRPQFRFVHELAKGEVEPLVALEKILAHFKGMAIPGLPRFTGGAVGYFGYETVQLVEDVPSASVNDIQLSDLSIMFFDTLLVFDNIQRKILIIVNSYVGGEPAPAQSLKPLYEDAVRKVAELRKILRRSVKTDLSSAFSTSELHYVIPRHEFLQKVGRC